MSKAAVAVALMNPKTPYNVGSAIRACSIFGVPTLRWTGSRITTAEGARMAGQVFSRKKARLPREERLKDYTNVSWHQTTDMVITEFAAQGFTPVAVEVLDLSESLAEFVHPERALYVFGPEDGTLGRATLSVCHRFVRIPSVTRTPLNLAAAVSVVLYDRHVKASGSDFPSSDVLDAESPVLVFPGREERVQRVGTGAAALTSDGRFG